MFLDVDDMIDERLLENLQEYINQDIEIIKYKMKIIRDDKEILADGPVFGVINGQEAFNRLCFKDKFLDSPCLYLMKKDLINRINLRFEKNVYHEDFGLIPSLIINAKSIISTSYYGYKYFQTDESIMRNSDYKKEKKRVNDKFSLYTKLYKNLNSFKLQKKTRDNLLEYYTNSIIISIKNLKLNDRKIFENRIRKRGLIKNLKARNLKQLIKLLIININMEWYFKYFKERNLK